MLLCPEDFSQMTLIFEKEASKADDKKAKVVVDRSHFKMGDDAIAGFNMYWNPLTQWPANWSHKA